MSWEGFLDILHLNSSRPILTLPEQPVDKHLQEVPDVIVGFLRVRSWNLDKGTFLTHGVDIIYISDVVSVSSMCGVG